MNPTRAVMFTNWYKTRQLYSLHMKMKTFDKFSEYNLNGKIAKNRFIRSATNSHLDNTDGTISDAEIEMYDQLGRGEVGIVITGHLSVAPDLALRADIAQPSIGSDGFLPGLKRVADKIHEYGALAIAQISLAGPRGLSPFDFNDLSNEQIETVDQWFVDAAVRAKEAGFDGVQLHIAHFYFLQAVVRKELNHRTDKFGGCDENLIRLPKEIVEGIRRECGPEFIISAKLNSHNTNAGTDDYPLLAFYVDTLVKVGVDLVEISGYDFNVQPRAAQCYYLDAVQYLRKQFPSLPLSLVGGIYTEESIDRVLETTDFVSMSRALLTQPDFITKLHEKELQKSRCLHCNKCFEIFATKFERCVFGPVNHQLEKTFKE